MVKCNKDQVERLKKALKREDDPVIRQRNGYRWCYCGKMENPTADCRADKRIAEYSQSSEYGL
jgi:hypothetical protein